MNVKNAACAAVIPVISRGIFSYWTMRSQGYRKRLRKLLKSSRSLAEAEGPFTHRMKKQSGKCVFLSENLCSIYEARPIICRFYPFSLKSIDENMYIFSSTKECPGIGKGPFLQQEYFRQLFGEFQKAMNEKRV